MKEDADRALLRHPDNPFSDPVARLDTPVPPPDVGEIHRDVREAIHGAIESVRTGHRPAFVLVKGDPGQGKTHQLAWLRFRADEGAYYFVEIPPLKDAEAPFAHILRYMVQGLLAHRPAGAHAASSSLERLLWECLRRVAVSVRDQAREAGDSEMVARLDQVVIGDERFVDTFGALAPDDPKLGEALYAAGRRHPPLNQLLGDLGRVLCRMTDRAAQPAAFDWLRGVELPDEDLQLLGIKRSVESEDRSFEVLRALVSLAVRPIALCFDQLESTSGLLGAAGAVALSNALMEIYQQVPVCLVLMCQTQYWADFRGNIPTAARDRLRELPPLSLPTPEQALRLVEARLAAVWRGDVTPPYPSYPFQPDFVRDFVGKVRPTIRRIFAECGTMLDGMRAKGRVEEVVSRAPAAPRRALPPGEADGPRGAMQAAFVKKRNSLGDGALRDPASREEYLRSGILRMLSASADRNRPIGGAAVARVTNPTKPKNGARPPALVQLLLDGKQRTLALDVYNSDARGAWRVLERLRDTVQAREADIGVLVREAEVPIGPGARQTLGLAAALEQNGGGLVYMERDAAHRLVAAELLLDAASAAEVWVGDRHATRDEALSFLLEHGEVESALAPLVTRVARRAPAAAARQGRGGEADDLATRVLRVLRSEAPIMGVEALATALGVSPPELDGTLRALEAGGEVTIGVDRERAKVVGLRARGRA